MLPDFESLATRFKRQRFNPIRSLTPERLTNALDAAETGWLREAALIYETIEKRDAICRTVIGKRKAAVSRRPWAVLPVEGAADDPRAEAHQATLEYFYRHLRVTDATDLNVRTGMAGLVRQMMDATVQRYAAHEIVWAPGAQGLSAALRFVPIYFFENRSGRLRFVGPENRVDGMPLEEEEWMITVADSAVGEAIAIAWMFRRLAVQDWTAFNEKFSIPGVLGRTKAAKGTTEGNAMRDAIADFGSEWHGLVYNDDGTIKDPVQVITTAASQGLPQKEMAEYMDRLITILCRGGDLGTLSRQDSQGASLQGDESAALLEDDCAMVTEVLRTQLDPLVIRMVHGEEMPLAQVEIQPPSTEDSQREISIDVALGRLGVKQKPEELAERYGREHAPEADAPEARDQRPEARPGDESEAGRMMPEELADNEVRRSDEVQRVRRALARDLQPVGDRLWEMMQRGNPETMDADLQVLARELDPAAPAMEEALAVELARAFTGGNRN